jgi:serine/threonine protein kinase
VKATNILLNAKLEAKIADFGFSKAFNLGNEAQIATNTLVGTPGYVDPEYVNPVPAIQSLKVFIVGATMQPKLLFLGIKQLCSQQPRAMFIASVLLC